MSTFTHTKDNVELYRVRGNHTWGDFVIDAPAVGRGQILINSDYGSWSHYWGAIGATTSFREFLIKCDVPYLIGKLSGAPKWFNSEETRKNFKNALDECFKNDEITTEIYDTVLEEIENSDFSTGDSTYWNMSDEMSEIFPEAFEHMVYDHEPGITNFMKVIWPEFMKILKEEITVNV